MLLLRVRAIVAGCLLFVCACACVILASLPDPDCEPGEKEHIDRYRWITALIFAAVALLLWRLGIGGLL